MLTSSGNMQNKQQIENASDFKLSTKEIFHFWLLFHCCAVSTVIAVASAVASATAAAATDVRTSTNRITRNVHRKTHNKAKKDDVLACKMAISNFHVVLIGV